MATLSGTPFAIAYVIFGSTNDNELVTTMTNIFLLCSIGVLIWTALYSAPKYGKLGADKSVRKGGFHLTIPSRTAWMVGTIPAFMIPILLIIFTPGKQLWNFCNFAAIALFMIHYFNRLMIYPRQISKDAKPVELWTFLGGLVFTCSFNSFLQCHHLLNVFPTTITPNSYIGLMFSIGGMLINIYHDKLLTNLRTVASTKSGSGPTVYKIPRGGFFEYVSCANLLGEIVEWWGLAILTNGYPQFICAVYVTINLGVRAIGSHKFYKKTFSRDYPKNRKAFIPFLL